MGKGRGYKHPPEVWEQVKLDYMVCEESIRSIGKKHDVEPASITRRAKKEGWVRSTEMNQHIEQRVDHEVKGEEIKATEAAFPEVVKREVDKRVMTKKEALMKFANFQSELVEDVWEMWRHDNKVKPALGEEHDTARYGKAKIVQDVTTQAKKNVLGDQPLVDVDSDENEEDWGIVVPAQEKKRIEGAKSEK